MPSKKEPLTATVYMVDGSTETVSPKNGFQFTLKELQTLVDGYIQIVYLKDSDEIIVCNEEGKLNGLAYNEKVNNEFLHRTHLMRTDFIVGNVLVCNSKMIN